MAGFAVEAFGVIETFLALASLLIARAGVVEVDVVVAHAGFAGATGSTWVAEVIVRTFVASGSRVTHFAIAAVLGRG